MDGEMNIDPLVSMQQELCDMWGINNQTSVNQRRRDVEGLSKLQVENILLIDKLRMEADRENPGFLCSIGPWDGIGILNRFFEMVKSRKEK